MKKSIVVIVNPISGTKSKKNIIKLISERINKDLYDVRIDTTRYAGHGYEIATAEKEKGTDIIIAVGGDGTVNEIGRALAGSDTAMGIIPCGSGNGLARHLHIPMNVKEAIEVINGGHSDIIDHGIINEHPFFCTCGVGFDAWVTMAFTKKNTRGLLTYIETTLLEYIKYKPETYKLKTESEELTTSAFLITAANASQYGNNAYIAPRATLKDGLLNIVILKPFRTYDVPILAHRLFHKEINGSPFIQKILCKQLVMERESAGSAHFDGEPLEAGKEIKIEIIPHSLKVIVPVDSKEI
jgi:diacylglycerol kinase (ATP)